jgi:hypothetical protein
MGFAPPTQFSDPASPFLLQTAHIFRIITFGRIKWPEGRELSGWTDGSLRRGHSGSWLLDRRELDVDVFPQVVNDKALLIVG